MKRAFAHGELCAASKRLGADKPEALNSITRKPLQLLPMKYSKASAMENRFRIL